MTNRLSVIVIGYNEGANLPACFASIRGMRPVPGYDVEVIYVDGGSEDDSIDIARQAGLDQVLGGEKRRRAAENRNLGLQAARGEYIQFLDGDMTLAPDWCAAAAAFLDANSGVAAVCGNIRELRDSVFFRAMEIDWGIREGVIRHCGGAALWRADILRRLGGFPEQVQYGEEPYLCWRVRNELELSIVQLNRPMVTHDLGHTSFRDYWRRCVRAGKTYAEIAALLKDTSDPLWLRETRQHLAWCLGFCLAVVWIFLIPVYAGAALFVILSLLVIRKSVAILRQGHTLISAFVYSLHTYFAKIPMSVGIICWMMTDMYKKLGHARSSDREQQP
mgnify:CR=1 FL=1